jgi:eukaryotic-like serine/threonine-protein kinase
MTDSPADAKSIFFEALEITSPDERGRYLDEACRGDPARRAEVEGLLQAHQEAGGFLAEPAAAPELAATAPSISEGPGTRIGRYKLLQEIGEGSFGVVFMAEQQEPFVHRVALKIIKPGMDSREVVARFEAERQALALMDHPNIAKVFDGGVTDSSRPYFVMELVKGVPITAFCDKNNSPTAERLRLFVDVCRAVQHAHQKGVIHRDLKPSNIMITLHDGVPVAKVIDFGVAKAISQRLTEKTLFTAYGQMIGTPLYMSPEQAEMSGLDVDTRSDIYSLGVLLYELLTGCTPLEAAVLREAGYAEMQRIIRETEPPRPSVRLSTSGQRLTEIAQHRSIDPKGLRRLVAGELDWIVMKALEKDRRRRYETASAFAGDVERFLRQEPVEAGPPTAGYRLQKFLRRNRLPLVMGTIVALGLILGLLVSFIGWRMALVERNRLERQNYAHAMGEAFIAWRSGNLSRLEELLGHWKTADRGGVLRGFEFRLLSALAQDASPRTVRYRSAALGSRTLGSREEVPNFLGLAFSWDSQWLVIALSDGRVLAREVSSFRENECPLVTPDRVNTTCFAASTGANLLLAGTAASDGSGEVRLWDVAYDRPPKCTRIPLAVRHDAAIESVALSEAASVGASLSVDGVIKCWRIPGGELLGEYRLTKRWHATAQGVTYSSKLAFSPDSKLLAVSNSTCVEVFVPGTDQPPVRLDIDHLIMSFNFLPKGDGLVVCSEADTRVWRLTPEGPTRTEVPIAWERFGASSFSPQEPLLATAGLGNKPSIRLWHAQTWQQVGSLIPKGRVEHITISPNGCRLAAATRDDNRVSLWDLSQVRPTTLAHLPALWMWKLPFAISPQGGTIACRGVDRTVTIWDVRTGRTRELDGHSDTVYAVAMSPDGKWIASGSFDRTVRLWSLPTEDCITTFEGFSGVIADVTFSADGRWLAASDETGEVRVWEVETRKCCQRLRHAAVLGVNCLRFSPRGDVLATGGRHDPGGVGSAHLWTMANSQLPGEELVTSGACVQSLSFSPNGRLLAVVSGSDEVEIWDVASRTKHAGLRSNGVRMEGASFSPNGETLVGIDSAGQMKFWRVSSWEEAATLRLGETLRRVEFLPDGNGLVTASMEGFLRVWPALPSPAEP